MSDIESPIICLNYCMTDPETGYCLSCGRPPIPVTESGLKFAAFSGSSFESALKAMQIVESASEVGDDAAKEGTLPLTPG